LKASYTNPATQRKSKFTLQKAVRFLFLGASLLALLASLLIFLFSGGTQVSESTDGLVTERHLSWLESQGWWGIAILFIFSALYYGPLRFFGLSRYGMVYLFGITAIAVTLLAMFSIGLLYLPSALLVLLGLLLLAVDKRAPH
jgi:hypothetical protein